MSMSPRTSIPIASGDQLAEITREARQQLSSIQGYTEMVQEELDQASGVLGDLDRIRQAVDRLTEIVAHLEEEAANARTLATVDPLTGIPNRRAFFEHGQMLFDESSVCSLILLDVDKFKHINDHYGHLVGDEVLAAVVERFQRAIRDGDMLARLAGDEFVLLLPGSTYDVAMSVAARLRQKVTSEPVRTSGGLVPVTVSLGVTERADEHRELKQLVESADVAMYDAKRAGRNRVA